MRSRWLLATAVFCAASATGHEVRPAYLGITEISPDVFEVLWKQPLLGNRRLPLEPVLPEHCVLEVRSVDDVRNAALIQHWTADCGPGGLVGSVIGIEGLSSTLTDVLVNVAPLDGTSVSALLRPEAPYFTVDSKGRANLPGYLTLGVEHLLFGFDHILFVIGLMFFLTKPGPLIKAITAFTIAHSITLGLAALEIVRLSQAPVEAVIALSILLLAVERLRGAEATITARHTWIVAFVFGLLHGFGFAGALADTGLPKANALWALFLFNLGVEIGQLVIVAAALTVVACVRHAKVLHGSTPPATGEMPALPHASAAGEAPPAEGSLPQWLINAPLYGIGSIASYWFVSRTVLIF